MVIDDFNNLYKQYKMKLRDKALEKERLCELQDKSAELSRKIEAGKKAREIFQTIAQETQANVEQHISNMGTLALKSVSAEFPKVVLSMTIRRNQLEADLSFEYNGELFSPMKGFGGGPKDIASFALFVAYWGMDKNRSVLILDEPFRQVSPDLQDKVSQMIKMISEKLGIQIIMVSHADAINACADRTFEVDFDGKKSTVRMI